MLHIRHATFYIFYARFPNSYLRSIAHHGSNYLQHLQTVSNVVDTEDAKVQLEQSGGFRMRIPAHQAAFFRLLAKILYYLVSGNSDVGYLSMDDWNPFFKKVFGLQVTSSSPHIHSARPFFMTLVSSFCSFICLWVCLC